MKKADRITAPRESRVLVVDDEPDIRELLEFTLIKMGIDVALAGSVGEAKARLQESRFDLCLTDMRLPDGEGLDLVEIRFDETPDSLRPGMTARVKIETAKDR